MNYYLHLLVGFCVYSIQALSLNIISGYCGMFSMAHAGFFAIGCYVYALMTLKLGIGFVAAAAIAALATALMSTLLSLPSCRLTKDNFILMSIAVQMLLFSALQYWYDPSAALGSWTNLTNGPSGISGIPKPTFFGKQFVSLEEISIVAMVLACLCFLISWRTLASPWGRMLQAMRDDELVLRGLGTETCKQKAYAFALSCGMVGIAGALYASFMNFIVPEGTASLDSSILMACMVVIGGVGNLRGPIIGAGVLMIIIPDLLHRLVPIAGPGAANLRLMLYGALLVVVVHLRPQGLAGTYRIE